MPKSGVKIKLKPNKTIRRLYSDQLIQNMRVATVWTRDKIKLKMNRGQPTRSTRGGRIVGLDPSRPGEPPKKITSQLQNSLVQKVIASTDAVHGLVGSTLKKAAPLELGNRKGTLKPRPAFRPVLIENRQKLLNILAKGRGGI